MRNIIKFKITLIFISLSVFGYLFLWRKNFFIEPKIIKWRELSWDDFRGFTKPFTTYEAGVWNDIFLEYDSVENAFYAYAGLDIERSYVKEGYEEYPDLLRHEQYHFNIAEVMARKLNKYLSEKKPDNPEDILHTIRNEHSELQDLYDNETNHSTVVDMQRYWEYKTDSMLREFGSEPGGTTDYYSGARIFFGDTPNVVTSRTGNLPTRFYQLIKYGMDLNLRILEVGYHFSYDEVRDKFTKYASDSLNIIRNNISETEGKLLIDVITYDSANNLTEHMKINVQMPYSYIVSTRYPEQGKGYRKISESFHNSFEIVDVSKFWISQLNSNDSTVFSYKEEKRKAGEEFQKGECIVYRSDSSYNFTGRAIFTDEGDFIMSYIPIGTPDSAIYKFVANVNGEVIVKEPHNKPQLIYVPAESQNPNELEIYYGYILKKDSVEYCWQFYHTGILYTSEE